MATKEKFAVILAGGGGTRLWPVSRRKKPKQFLRLFNNETLLQRTFKRVNRAFTVNQIYIVTSESLVDGVKREIGSLNPANILLEPVPKNTLSAIGLAAIRLSEIDPEAVFSTFAADHYIGDERKFVEVLASSQEAARSGDYIVTIGIKPTNAETGYGYIRAGEKAFTINGKPVFRVREFKEKPDSITASKYLANGDFFWNANINSYKVSTLLLALQKFKPNLLKILKSTRLNSKNKQIFSLWEKLPNEAIDTAILEKAANVLMIPGDFSWADVGDWETIYALLRKEGEDNLVLGKSIDHISFDSSGCLIYGEDGIVATIGLKNTIVIKTDDAVLVVPRSRSQEVKKIVEKLKQTKKEKFL